MIYASDKTGSPYEDMKTSYMVGIPIETILKQNIDIKANLYDETGQIIASEDSTAFEDFFDGYDTFSITFDEPDILERVQKIRLYAAR